MKKLKLVMSIATMCLAIAVLCFGVLAATSVTYTIEGTISYDIEDVYVDVNTTVYKSAKYLSATQQNALLESLGNPANLSSAKTTYGLTETGDSYSFSTVNEVEPSKSGIELKFNKDVKTYAIVVNVKNLTNNNAWAVVDSRISTSTNVQIVDNYQLNIAKDGTGKNVIILVTPTDVTQPIASGTFTFNLVFGSDEYVNSATNMSKMTIAEDKSVTKASADISGVLEIPGDCLIQEGTYMGYYVGAFSRTKLSHVILDEGITRITFGAFSECSSLTSIEIPSSVTRILQGAFNICSNLRFAYITDLAKWCQIDFIDGFSTPFYYGADLYLNRTKEIDLVIPDGVTSIKNNVFCGCSSLTSITIPSSVTSIRECAFSYCSGLESITVSGIGGTYSAVNNCLIKGNELVLGCKNSVIPTDGSVTSIGQYAFYYCSSLTSITIPSSVTKIGSDAFYGCSGLVSITIPSSVTSIGGNAFYNCSSLTSATFEDPNGWSAIHDHAGTRNFTATELENTSTNATYLTKTYSYYDWEKTV